MKKTREKKVLLISSAGGHLSELLELRAITQRYVYLIVTEDVPVTRALESQFNMQFLRPNSKRGSVSFWLNNLVNAFLSVKILFSFNPSLIITTGSHTAVPMCLLAKLFGKKVVWILTYARVTTKEKSANFIYPVADVFIVQWETAQQAYPNALYLGGIY